MHWPVFCQEWYISKAKGLGYRKAKLSEDRFSKFLLQNLTLNMIVTETFKVTLDNPRDVSVCLHSKIMFDERLLALERGFFQHLLVFCF